MKVFAIGSIRQAFTPEQRQRIMPKEVPDTLKLLPRWHHRAILVP
jgi:hypothetical protein